MRWRINVGPLIGLATGILLLATNSVYARTLGGMMLFCLVPGLALINWVLPRPSQLNLLTRLMLGTAASYMVSTLTILVLNSLGLELTDWTLALALSVVSLALMALCVVSTAGTADDGADQRQRENWLYVVIVLAAFCFFRFVGLGQGELIAADEIRISWPIASLIAGKGSVFFEYPKGPTEVLTALAFVAFANGYHEFALRFPFALASVISGVLVYVLGKEMFSERIGLFAGLLLALEGAYLAQSRFAQYQALVILTGLAATYCFWRATRDPADRSRFLLLGSAFFGLGCLTHYGGIVVLPALLILYLASGRLPWKREALLLLACAAIVGVINAPYYLLFFFSPQWSKTRSYYFGRRLAWERGIYNNLRQFLTYSTFTSSIYYVAFMWAALLGALAMLAHKATSRLALTVASASFAVGLAICLWQPRWVQVGNISLAFLFFLPCLLVFVFRKDLPVTYRAVGLWFMTGFVILGFFSQQPMTHWYVISPAWALLAATGLNWVFGLAEHGADPVRRGLLWASFVLLMFLFSSYSYALFIHRAPTYTEAAFNQRNTSYWTPSGTKRLGGLAWYGVPVQQGWKALGYLYRTGILRGRLRASSKEFSVRESLEWYLGHKWDNDDNSRFMFYVEDARHDVALSAIEEWHKLAGRVLVDEQPKILIYELKDTARPGPLVDYRFEELEPLYDQRVGLEERLKLDEISDETSKVYHEAAGVIEEASTPGDRVVFTDGRQVGPFSYHYAGDLPYHIPDRPMSPGDLEDWLSAHPIDGTTYVLLWASPGSGEREAWDAWLEKQTQVKGAVWNGNVGLAIYSQDRPGDVVLLPDARLGSSIQLLGYRLSPVAANKTVLLSLFWATGSQPDRDYTVFTHLVDAEGRLAAQKDNEPVNGTLETSVWRTDRVVRDDYAISVESVPSGEYSVYVGMYDGQSGERLQAVGQGATPDRSLRLPGSVRVP